MSTYRKEWGCCGSVTETDAWEPESCPFCTDGEAPFRKDAERYRKLCEVPQAIDAFTAAYYNTQTKAQIDEAIDKVPAVGAA